MKLHTSTPIMLLIKGFEGLRLESYQCIGGYWTVGYGHKLKSQEAYSNISLEEAEALFEEDIAKAEGSVLNNIKVNLKQCQFDALVSFTFNVGGAALQRSTIRQKINGEMFLEAKEEFKRWVYCNGFKSKGLILRRTMEAKLFAGKLDFEETPIENTRPKVAPRAGIEPATKRLTVACSADELPRN